MVSDQLASAVVHVGSVVTVRGQSEIEQDLKIVDEASGNGIWQLTTRTPLGHALLGRRAGEEVSIVTDAGTAKFKVVRIKT